MDVRPVRPTDAPLVFTLALDASSQLVAWRTWSDPTHVLRSVARTLLPLHGRAWIARDGEHVALLAAQPRRYVIGWDVTQLAVHGDPDIVLNSVVHAAICHLQSRGAPRLFARGRAGSQDLLASAGFVALATEYVLTGESRGAPATTLPYESRYRMPQDAWPLHQLEHALTPALVRQLEGLTSQEWTHASRKSTEIVVERDGQIVAWIGCGAESRHDPMQIGLLVHPDHADLAVTLVEHALGTLPPGRQCVARVREYQPEALQALEEAGFRIVAEETLMVKHAGIELARETRGLLRVAGIPSLPVFHSHHLAHNLPATGRIMS